MILCTSVVFFVGLCIHTSVMVLYVCVCACVWCRGGMQDEVKTSCTSTRRSAISHDACSGVSYHSPCMVHLGSPPGTWHDDSSTQHRVHKAHSPHECTQWHQPHASGWLDAEGRLYYSQHKCPVATPEQTANSEEVYQGLTKPTVVAATRRDSDVKAALPCRYIHTRENLHLGATALSSKGLAAL